MADAKRKTTTRQVVDVHKPGKSAADSTSKPIIVNHRQIIRDPMVTNEATSPVPDTKTAPALPKDIAVPQIAITPPANEVPETPEVQETPETEALVEEAKPAEIKHELVLTPPSEEPDAVDEPADATEETPAEEPEAPNAPAVEPLKPAKAQPAAKAASTEKIKQEIPDAETNAKGAEAAAEETEAKRQSELQKLAEKKQYFLPINAVEQRRAQQFIALGIFACIILALAWLNIALDAGLIQIDNIKPVTNFFSN